MIDDIGRADHAQRLLNDPLLNEAFSEIEKRLVGQLSQAEIARDRAEYLRQLLVANKTVRRYLENVLTTGKIVEAEQKQASLAKRLIDQFR